MGPFMLVIIGIANLAPLDQPHATLTTYETAEECFNARNAARAHPLMGNREEMLITCVDLSE